MLTLITLIKFTLIIHCKLYNQIERALLIRHIYYIFNNHKKFILSFIIDSKLRLKVNNEFFNKHYQLSCTVQTYTFAHILICNFIHTF